MLVDGVVVVTVIVMVMVLRVPPKDTTIPTHSIDTPRVHKL